MVTQDDTRALRQAAARAQNQPTWHHYALYCELRSQGIRKAALRELDVFLHEATGWTFDARRAFVAWLCQAIYDLDWIAYHPLLSRLLPTPLFVGLVQPTLRDWIDCDATNAVAHRWAGLFLRQ